MRDRSDLAVADRMFQDRLLSGQIPEKTRRLQSVYALSEAMLFCGRYHVRLGFCAHEILRRIGHMRDAGRTL